MLQGLTGWHFLILLGFVVVPVVIVVVVVAFLRRRSADERPTPVVSFTLWLAAVWAGIAVLGGVLALLGALLSPAVTLTVPVQSYWPQLPGVTIEPGEATVVGGGFSTAELTVEGLSSTARILWGIGSMLGAFVPGAIAALIALICFQLLRGAAFAPAVARGAMVTAVIVAAGGLATQVLCGIAGSMASREALTISGSSYEGYPEEFSVWEALPQSTFSMQIEFWPIAAGLAFAALAAVFAYGSKLQRETAGLV